MIIVCEVMNARNAIQEQTYKHHQHTPDQLHVSGHLQNAEKPRPQTNPTQCLSSETISQPEVTLAWWQSGSLQQTKTICFFAFLLGPAGPPPGLGPRRAWVHRRARVHHRGQVPAGPRPRWDRIHRRAQVHGTRSAGPGPRACVPGSPGPPPYTPK